MKPTTLFTFLFSAASIAAVPLSPPWPLYSIAPREPKWVNATAFTVVAGGNTTGLVNASASANTTVPLNAAKIPVEVVPAPSSTSVSRARVLLPSISIQDLLRNGTGHDNSTEADSESDSDSYTDSDVSESDSDVENDVDEPSNVAEVLPVIFSPFPVAEARVRLPSVSAQDLDIDEPSKAVGVLPLIFSPFPVTLARVPLPSVGVQDLIRNGTMSGNGTDTGSDNFTDSDSYTDSDMSDSDSDDEMDLFDAYLKGDMDLNDAPFKGDTDFGDAFLNLNTLRRHRKKKGHQKNIPFKPAPNHDTDLIEISKELSTNRRCLTKEFLDSTLHSMSEIRRYSQHITEAVLDGKLGYGDRSTTTGSNLRHPQGGRIRRDGKFAISCPGEAMLAVVMYDLSVILKHQHRIYQGIQIWNANVQDHRTPSDLRNSGKGTPYDGDEWTR